MGKDSIAPPPPRCAANILPDCAIPTGIQEEDAAHATLLASNTCGLCNHAQLNLATLNHVQLIDTLIDCLLQPSMPYTVWFKFKSSGHMV